MSVSCRNSTFRSRASNSSKQPYKAPTARAAFDGAVEDAKYEHGHGGYTGTIAEKQSFVMIDPAVYAPEAIRHWETVKGTATVKAQKKLPERERVRTGPMYSNKAQGMVDRSLAEACAIERKACSERIRRLKQKGANRACEVVEWMMRSNHERIEDKWGPAGCVQLKKREFLFFGLASC